MNSHQKHNLFRQLLATHAV